MLGTRRSFLGRGRRLTISKNILRLPGIIAYWPLGEAAGPTADNLEDTAARDGLYVGAPGYQGATMPNGDVAPTFDGTNDYVNIYSASLNSAFDPDQFWLLAILKLSAENWADGLTRYAIGLYADANNYISFGKTFNVGQLMINRRANAAYVQQVVSCSSTNWQLFAASMDLAGDELFCLLNGVKQTPVKTGMAAWTGAALDPSLVCIASRHLSITTYRWAGALGHVAIGVGSQLTEAMLAPIWAVLNNNSFWLGLGDSKTQNEGWQGPLVAAIETQTGTAWNRRKIFESGSTVAELLATVNAQIGDVPGRPAYVLINIGVVDMNAPMTSEENFKADYSAIIDTIRFTWTGISIYLMRPWKVGYDAESDTMAGWISDIISGYASGVYAGPDERIWLEGGDNGATMTSDGVHYSVAGHAACAVQWLAVLYP